jgi:two-component system, LytTR family, sensor kinase
MIWTLNVKNSPLSLKMLGLFAGAWALATVFFSVIQAAGNFSDQKPLAAIFLANGLHCALWTAAIPVMRRLMGSFAIRSSKIKYRYSALFAIAVSAAVAISFSLIGLVSLYAPSRFVNPAENFRSLLRSAWIWIFQVDVLIAMLILSALLGVRFWHEFRSERQRATRLEHQLVSSRLDALRMQLHPHFLFNTLNSIAALVTEQPHTARKMIACLGDFLRLSLQAPEAELRRLEEELHFVRLYLSIERLRLEDRLSIEYECDQASQQALIPFLVLQPVFENAIRHGAARVVGQSVIRFRSRVVDNRLNMTLENDRAPNLARSSKLAGNGLGLANMRARLQLHYGQDFRLELRHADNKSSLEISLPYSPARQEFQPKVAI